MPPHATPGHGTSTETPDGASAEAGGGSIPDDVEQSQSYLPAAISTRSARGSPPVGTPATARTPLGPLPSTEANTTGLVTPVPPFFFEGIKTAKGSRHRQQQHITPSSACTATTQASTPPSAVLIPSSTGGVPEAAADAPHRQHRNSARNENSSNGFRCDQGLYEAGSSSHDEDDDDDIDEVHGASEVRSRVLFHETDNGGMMPPHPRSISTPPPPPPSGPPHLRSLSASSAEGSLRLERPPLDRGPSGSDPSPQSRKRTVPRTPISWGASTPPRRLGRGCLSDPDDVPPPPPPAPQASSPSRTSSAGCLEGYDSHPLISATTRQRANYYKKAERRRASSDNRVGGSFAKSDRGSNRFHQRHFLMHESNNDSSTTPITCSSSESSESSPERKLHCNTPSKTKKPPRGGYQHRRVRSENNHHTVVRSSHKRCDSSNDRAVSSMPAISSMPLSPVNSQADLMSEAMGTTVSTLRAKGSLWLLKNIRMRTRTMFTLGLLLVGCMTLGVSVFTHQALSDHATETAVTREDRIVRELKENNGRAVATAAWGPPAKHSELDKSKKGVYEGTKKDVAMKRTAGGLRPVRKTKKVEKPKEKKDEKKNDEKKEKKEEKKNATTKKPDVKKDGTAEVAKKNEQVNKKEAKKPTATTADKGKSPLEKKVQSTTAKTNAQKSSMEKKTTKNTIPFAHRPQISDISKSEKRTFAKMDRRMYGGATTNSNGHPRTVSLDDSSAASSPPQSRTRTVKLYPADFSDNTQYYSLLDSEDEKLSKMEIRDPYSEGECVPMKEWQTTYNPSCNGMHEIGMDHLGLDGWEGSDMAIFGSKGFWRNAWKVDFREHRQKDSAKETVVLKTLKYEHNFEDAHFEHDRIDAVAMERLTSSPHVINVYGFCGHSVITEFADQPRLGTLADKAKKKPLQRLKIARDIANGLADVHGIDGDGNATFVHLDINPANVVSVGGTLKLNDFNIGIILRWNTTSNTHCGFPAQYPNPQWRSPEEARNSQHLSVKVDVFSMGHIFFRLICGHEPWNKLEPGGKPTKEEINEKVQRGELPFIPDEIMNTSDKELIAIRDAMLQCYNADPEKRPSARSIANSLEQALLELS